MRKLQFRSLAVLFIAMTLLVTIVCAADEVDVRLNGTWKVVRVDGNEEWSEEIPAMRFVFKGDKLFFREDEADEPLEVKVRTNLMKSPAHMDLSWKVEAERERNNVNLPCIYVIEGDTLKICLARHDLFELCRIIGDDGTHGPRPTSFKEAKTTCIIAERVKLKEKK